MATRKTRLHFWVVPSVIFFDQLSKFLAPCLGLAVVKNQGVVFGLFPGLAWEAIVFFLLTGLVIYLWKKSFSGSLSQGWGLMLILGGGLSNFLDRLFLGFIRDFIDLKIWPVFNLADAAITVGVILLLAGEVKRRTPEGKDGT